eukprot:680138-Pelagomonas_calceolata.AAC.5
MSMFGIIQAHGYLHLSTEASGSTPAVLLPGLLVTPWPCVCLLSEVAAQKGSSCSPKKMVPLPPCLPAELARCRRVDAASTSLCCATPSFGLELASTWPAASMHWRAMSWPLFAHTAATLAACSCEEGAAPCRLRRVSSTSSACGECMDAACGMAAMEGEMLENACGDAWTQGGVREAECLWKME